MKNWFSEKKTLHWIHWVIVILSGVVTIFAWYFSKSQLEEKTRDRFDREAEHVVELVRERMRKYEDGLWGGVGAIQALGGDVSQQEWLTFSTTMNLNIKYPGINGIGVIVHVPPEQLEAHLEQQRRTRPDYRLRPAHDKGEYWPIVYIEPVEDNRAAVGLDMAHETNRFTASKKARDTGASQITAPIVLVQDAEKTPGFLFFAPYYQGGTYPDQESRQRHFKGMVYAPFVVNKLMEGTLAKERRHVGIRLMDSDEVIYDEFKEGVDDFDPAPMFERQFNVDFYGRKWMFDIHSSQSFRTAVSLSQPTMILIFGLTIDLFLFVLFFLLSRSNHKLESEVEQRKNAEISLQAAHDDLEERIARRTENLKRSNKELEQFAYVASHDLQEPLRKVASFCELLHEEYGDKLDEDGKQYLHYAVDGSRRMRRLIQDLLLLSRVQSEGKELLIIDSGEALEAALYNLSGRVEEVGGQVTHDEMPKVVADTTQFTQLLQNLIGNGLKYRQKGVPPKVHVGVRPHNDSEWLFSVADNGIGIEDKYHEQVFGIFKRLHHGDYKGTGIGLALCKRIVERMGGKIWIESKPTQGSTFFFTASRTTSAEEEENVG